MSAEWSIVTGPFHTRHGGALLLLVAVTSACAQQLPPNLALHKPYTYSPQPNYDLCTDANDVTQLTDGVYTGESFWTRPTTVGWAVGSPVTISVDLGQDEPIAGAAFSTAAGHGGVIWPRSIVVLTSLDGATWHRAGDLARLDRQPPVTEMTNHIFRATNLKTHGRYVRFLIGKLGYTFVDEVEVYRGADQWRQQPPAGREVTDMDAAALEAQGVDAMLERLRADLQEATAAIQASRLPEADKLKLLDTAAQYAAEIEALPDELPPGFKTIMPFSDLQARLFALHAPARRAAGFAPFVAWASNRWDPLLPTQAPAEPPTGLPALQISMMRNEHRAEALNLTNSSDEAVTLLLNVRGLPGGDNPGWLSVREVQFSDTYVRQPIAAALPPAPASAAGYRISIPAGMTRQVWLEVDSSTIEPGDYRGTVDLTGADANLKLSLTLHISQLSLAQPDLIISGWDYTETDAAAYDGASVPQPQFIAKLREFGVNMTWSGHAPTRAKFGEEGRLLAPPDYTIFDGWVRKWPGARGYAIFGLGEDFEGQDPTTPRARLMVAEWLRAWADHALTLGVKPEQIVLLLLDEPTKPEQDERFIAWAEAVQAAGVGFRVWLDPCHEDPTKVNPRLYELCDVLSPSGARFIGSPQSYRDFFIAQRDAGRELQFYNCVNGKHLDPITYHRGTFWLNIRYGGHGASFWAFGDEGRSGNSFRAYTSPTHMFSPLFLDPPQIIDGKHMAAIREGAEDYAYFAMLRRRLEELHQGGVDSEAVRAADKLLADGPERVAREITIDRLGWNVDKDRSVMDEVRLEALALLEKL